MPSVVSHTAAMPPIQLDRAAELPLPTQLVAALRGAIDAGQMRPGEPLPATRAVASRLGVSRGTVVTAYEQLIAEGYLASGQGRGTVVNPGLGRVRGEPSDARLAAAEATGAPRAPRTGVGTSLAAPRPGAAKPNGPLAPGAPLTDTIERPAWRAAWREAAAHAHETPPMLGSPELRGEIAEHLRRMRGTHRAAGDIIVTAGARDGLGLLLTALGTTRGRGLVVGVEDPGYPSLRGVAARHGARVVALETDADGLVTAALPQGVLDLVIVTPSHQHPVGAALPLQRRRELIAWARTCGAIVVEDDYDSELRYAGAPVPALAALDDPQDGVVVTLGSFSATVTPALAAGYLLAPAPLRAHLEPVRAELGNPVSSIVQSALARVLASGEIRRHTARMRRRYAARRSLVLGALGDVATAKVRPMHGGLHAVIELEARGGGRNVSSGRSGAEARLVAACERAGLGAVGLSEYWQRRGVATGHPGVVIGMGGPDEAVFRRALDQLAGLITAAGPADDGAPT